MNWVRKVYRNQGIALTDDLIKAFWKLYEWSKNYTDNKAHERFTFLIREDVRLVSPESIEEFKRTFVQPQKETYKDDDLAPLFIETVISLNFPGLYFFLDEEDNPIYIGKSINLSVRVFSSLRERRSHLPVRFRYLRTDTESDCHILEPYYIAKLKPFANNEHASLDDCTFEIPHKYELSEPIWILYLDAPF